MPWRLREVPLYWRKANVAPVFRKGRKQIPWNYSLTPIPGKFIRWILLEHISGYIKKVIGNSQLEFTEGWSTWQPSMINWQDLWTGGEQWMSFTLTLASFLTPSCTTRWIKSQLSGQAQWLLFNGLNSTRKSPRVCKGLYCDQSCSTTSSMTWKRQWECTVVKFTEDIEQGKLLNTVTGNAATQWDLDRQEERANGNFV